MQIPERLNGYPVIEFEQHSNGYATVMVAKPSAEAVEELIVATWWPELTTSWSWGHYFPARGLGRHSDDRSWAVKEMRAAANREFVAAKARNRNR